MLRISLVVQWFRLHLPIQGVRVLSLTGELRSDVLWGQKKQNVKQWQYCNKFNKDLKSCPHQIKKSLKKKKSVIFTFSVHYWLALWASGKILNFSESQFPPSRTNNNACQLQSPHLSSSCSVAQSCPTLCNPMDCSMPGLPVHHQLQSWLKLMSIELVMPSNHLILCHPLLLLSSILPASGSFLMSHCIRWPKYWSFSFSISPSNEYSGLISFRIDWFDLLAVQGTLKSLLQ